MEEEVKNNTFLKVGDHVRLTEDSIFEYVIKDITINENGEEDEVCVSTIHDGVEWREYIKPYYINKIIYKKDGWTKELKLTKNCGIILGTEEQSFELRGTEEIQIEDPEEELID